MMTDALQPMLIVAHADQGVTHERKPPKIHGYGGLLVKITVGFMLKLRRPLNIEVGQIYRLRIMDELYRRPVRDGERRSQNFMSSNKESQTLAQRLGIKWTDDTVSFGLNVRPAAILRLRCQPGALLGKGKRYRSGARNSDDLMFARSYVWATLINRSSQSAQGRMVGERSRFNSTPMTLWMRAATTAAINELPPRAKKSSSRPMPVSLRTSAQMPASNDSVSVSSR